MWVVYQVNADQDYYSRHRPCVANGHVPLTDIEVELRNFQIEEKPTWTPFVDGSRTGAIIIDSSGFQNHGTVNTTQTPTYSSTSAMGRGAMLFDPSKNNVIEGPTPRQFYKDFTVSGWIYFTTEYW